MSDKQICACLQKSSFAFCSLVWIAFFFLILKLLKIDLKGLRDIHRRICHMLFYSPMLATAETPVWAVEPLLLEAPMCVSAGS